MHERVPEWYSVRGDVIFVAGEGCAGLVLNRAVLCQARRREEHPRSQVAASRAKAPGEGTKIMPSESGSMSSENSVWLSYVAFWKSALKHPQIWLRSAPVKSAPWRLAFSEIGKGEIGPGKISTAEVGIGEECILKAGIRKICATQLCVEHVGI